VRLLGDDRPRTLALAAGLGAASSSCSYAAVALARSLFRKGADFTAAMAFEIASTNLVVELGIILALLMGWQFTLAEFVGGPIMIITIAVLFRVFLRRRLVAATLEQADKGVAGSMEGHAAMDMAIASGGTLWHRLRTRRAFTSVSHIFVMEWAAVIRDIVLLHNLTPEKVAVELNRRLLRGEPHPWRGQRPGRRLRRARPLISVECGGSKHGGEIVRIAPFAVLKGGEVEMVEHAEAKVDEFLLQLKERLGFAGIGQDINRRLERPSCR